MSLSPSAAAFFSEHHAAWVKGGRSPEARFSLFSENERDLWRELEAEGLAKATDDTGKDWVLTDAGKQGP